MTKRNSVLSILCLAIVIIVTAGLYGLIQPAPTLNLISPDGARLLLLKDQWARGNVIALLRHAERCDRTDAPCLASPQGITVRSKDIAVNVGKGYGRLPKAETIFYHSPVIRAVQTAEYMFGDLSHIRHWLRSDCKTELYDEIFNNKQSGKNLVLMTHSTCIDPLGKKQGKKVVNMKIHEPATYNISVFLIIDPETRELTPLGYLYASDWHRI